MWQNFTPSATVVPEYLESWVEKSHFVKNPIFGRFLTLYNPYLWKGEQEDKKNFFEAVSDYALSFW